MKAMMKPSVPVLCVLLAVLAACGPATDPVLDEATVAANRASVRQRNSATSRTIHILDAGAKVDVLERRDNWYRIRQGGHLEGWMEESTLITNATAALIRERVIESQDLLPQNTGSIRQTANLRVEPGRTTAVIRRLTAGTKVEVLDRVTTRRPDSATAYDIWFNVRPSPTEIGWVFSGLMEFDVPVELAQYTEGRTYTAVKILNQVTDSIAGPINWYVVGERRRDSDPHLDFDGIRVYTWNLTRHRYETAFRPRNLRGVYPLEVSQSGGDPAFHFYELGADGSTKHRRDFVMQGVVARELRPAVPETAAPAS